MNRIRGFAPLLLLITLALLVGCELDRDQPVTEDTPIDGQLAPSLSESPISVPTANELDDSSFDSVAPSQPDGIYLVEGEVLVQFKQEVVPELPTEKRESQGVGVLSIGSADIDPDLQELGIISLEPILAEPAQASGGSIGALRAQAGETSALYIAKFDTAQGNNALDVAAALASNLKVEYAEPNYVAFATGGPAYAPANFNPNDPFFNFQWNFNAIQMPQAWDSSTGQNVIVAILDTGIAYENYAQFQQAPDLTGTQFVQGYDFVGNDNHANDDQGHGTHVAGTLAQTTNNGQGVAGIAYNARIMPVKVLDSRGQGGYGQIIQGINYAVNSGARVINLSLAGNSPSRALEDAIQNARNRGVIVVAAAGNNGGNVGYPAAYANTIAVGAVRYDQTRASYSNFGSQIDIVAPGGQNKLDQNGDGKGDGIVQQTFKAGEINNFRYLFFEGTSMASPHISGVIALLLAKSPGLSPAQIENILYTSAKDLGPVGRDSEYGYGLVQAADALNRIGGPVPPTATPTPTITPIPGGPTPTPTATSTPVTPIPSTGNILQNSDFEANTGWQFGPTRRQASYSTVIRRSGARSVVVGITDPTEDTHSFSSVSQKITIPANATKVTLQAYIYPISDFVPANPGYGYQDLQVISILNPYFREIKRLHNSLSNSRTWEVKTYDVTEFRGQTIFVYFGVVNRTYDGKITAMYVDDVILTVE